MSGKKTEYFLSIYQLNVQYLIIQTCLVFSNSFIENLKNSSMPMVQKLAEDVVKSQKYQQFYIEKQLAKTADLSSQTHVDHKAERREERRRKAASGKGGGGTQGRETKTKAVKKHQRSKQVTHDSDSDEASNANKKTPTQLEIVSVENIEEVIKEALENEGLDDLTNQIAEYLQGYIVFYFCMILLSFVITK